MLKEETLQTWKIKPPRIYFQFSTRRLISVAVSAHNLFHSFSAGKDNSQIKKAQKSLQKFSIKDVKKRAVWLQQRKVKPLKLRDQCKRTSSTVYVNVTTSAILHHKPTLVTVNIISLHHLTTSSLNISRVCPLLPTNKFFLAYKFRETEK